MPLLVAVWILLFPLILTGWPMTENVEVELVAILLDPLIDIVVVAVWVVAPVV